MVGDDGGLLINTYENRKLLKRTKMPLPPPPPPEKWTLAAEVCRKTYSKSRLKEMEQRVGRNFRD